MKIPKVFLPEKDLEKKVSELITPSLIPGEGWIVEAEEFYAERISKALAALLREGYKPLFMPSIIDMRIEASGDERIWKYWYTTSSVMITGRTKQGSAVVVYAHVPNCLSNLDNMTKKEGGEKDVWTVPQDEFQRLLGLEDDKNVFVVDYETLKNSKSGVIELKYALEHPQTIPSLGGIERAEKYLERHKEVYREKMGVWHSDDLDNKPIGRFLFLGFSYSNCLYSNGFFSDARFVGVYKNTLGAAQKIVLTFDT